MPAVNICLWKICFIFLSNCLTIPSYFGLNPSLHSGCPSNTISSVVWVLNSPQTKPLSFHWAFPAFAACSCWDSSILNGFIHLAWLEAPWGRDSIRIISQPSWSLLPAPFLHCAAAPQHLRFWRMSRQHCPLTQDPQSLILQSPRSPTKRWIWNVKSAI